MNGQESMKLERNGTVESKLTSAPYTDVQPPYLGPRQLDMQMLLDSAIPIPLEDPFAEQRRVKETTATGEMQQKMAYL